MLMSVVLTQLHLFTFRKWMVIDGEGICLDTFWTGLQKVCPKRSLVYLSKNKKESAWWLLDKWRCVNKRKCRWSAACKQLSSYCWNVLAERSWRDSDGGKKKKKKVYCRSHPATQRGKSFNKGCKAQHIWFRSARSWPTLGLFGPLHQNNHRALTRLWQTLTVWNHFSV